MCKYRLFLGVDKLKGQEIAIGGRDEGRLLRGKGRKDGPVSYAFSLKYFMNWIRSKGLPAWVERAFMAPLN